MNRIVITEIMHHEKGHTAFILSDEKRRFLDLQLFEPPEKTLLNNIYTAYVEKIVPGIHAAFVRISDEQKCYLPLENLKSPVFTKKQSQTKAVCEGDELLVQVTKDAVKTKDPVVSTRLVFHGKHCLVTTDDISIGVSKKIPADRANELLSLGNNICPDHEASGYGLVFRTSAADISDKALTEDIYSVLKTFHSTLTAGGHERHGKLICRDLPGYLLRLKSQDLKNVEGIYTDQKDLYEEMTAFFPEWKESGFLHFYDDTAVGLSVLYHLRSNMDELSGKKVWLKSGANIIIETMETLTVIDVNSGKNQSKKAESLYSINKEAAVEIARQLRLRNISGMILIDFIRLKRKEENEELIRLLKQELKKDPVPVCFIDVTKLGLVELTRKKVYKSLREILSEIPKKY